MKIFDASITGSLQIPNYPSNPTGTTSGSLYFNTTDFSVYQYNGSSWTQIGASVGGVITTGSISENQSISGSLNVSNSLNVIGTLRTTGSLLLSGSADITGTFAVGVAASRDFQVSSTGTIHGNALTDTHIFTGALLLSGSGNITGTFVVGVGGTRDFQVSSTGTIQGNNLTDAHIFTGSLLVTGSADITGSLAVGVAGSRDLQVTSAGTTIGNAITDIHTLTGSLTVSNSLNIIGTVRNTGSMIVSSSLNTIGTLGVTGSVGVSGSQAIYGSGSGLFIVDGSVGRLFVIDDGLSGSLFSVNTVAGLPVIEAFSDNTVRIGQYGQRALYVSQSKVGIGKETSLNGILDISGTTTSVTGSIDVSGSVRAYTLPEIAATPSGSISIAATALTDISGMTDSVRAGSYIIDAWIFGQSSSNAGAAFAVSASGTITGLEVVNSGQLSTTTFGATAIQTANNTVSTTFMTTANAECWVHLVGRITMSTAGNITVRASKLTNGTLTLRNSSYLAVSRIT